MHPDIEYIYYWILQPYCAYIPCNVPVYLCEIDGNFIEFLKHKNINASDPELDEKNNVYNIYKNFHGEKWEKNK